MAITMTETEGAREWIARPNRSLTPTVRRGMTCLVVVSSLLVSGGFLLAGAWLVLPCAGLELALLVFALIVVDRRNASVESIRLEGDRLTVSTRLPHGCSQHSFHAGWARISFETQSDTGPDPLLCIRSHGHSASVGRLLTPAERRQLASELTSKLNSRLRT